MGGVRSQQAGEQLLDEAPLADQRMGEQRPTGDAHVAGERGLEREVFVRGDVVDEPGQVRGER